MCGFLGYYSLTPFRVSESQKEKIKKYIFPRGPDCYGVIESDRRFLAHGRLSIIDPENREADQPVETDRGMLLYNGEFFNYRDFTDQTSDTLFLFQSLLEEKSIQEFLSKFRGFYAIAWENKEKKEITLARDLLGQKPLYYYHDDEKLLFGSSIQAIKCLLPPCSIDQDAEIEFRLLGRISAPRTQYLEISQVLPGEIITFDREFQPISRRMSLESIPFLGDAADDLFLEAVKRRFVADVPVGILLSGGFDSSVVLGAAVELGMRPICFTMKPQFESRYSKDESEYATAYAKKFGLEHHVIEVGANDLKNAYDRYLNLMELPCLDGLNVFLMTSFVKKYVKVLLTGTGGDEVQGRYHHYAMENRLPSGLRGPYNLLKRSIFRSKEPFNFLKSLKKNYFYSQSHRNDLVQYLMPTLIRDGDWAAGMNSVEMRSPFLDLDLWKFSLEHSPAQVLAITEKYDLRPEIPPKSGFELPIELLFKENLTRIEALMRMRDTAWLISLK